MNITQIGNGVNPVTPVEKNIDAIDPVTLETKSIPQNENAQQPVDSNELDKSVSQANEIFKALDKSVKFIVNDDGMSNFRLKIIDTQTNEVIREYPDSYVVNVIKKINEMVGVLVDKKV